MSQTKAQLLGPVLGTVEYAGDVNFDSGTLFVDSANNRVGVGTDNPTQKLQVHNGGILIRGSATPNLNLTPTDGLLGNGDISFDGTNFTIVSNSSGANLVLGTFSAPRLTINSSGNVGIGTTNPAQKLHVENSLDGSTQIRVRNLNSGSNAYTNIVCANDTNGVAELGVQSSARDTTYPAGEGWLYVSGGLNLGYAGNTKIFAGGTERVRVTSDGDVYIRKSESGATKGSAALEFYGTTSGSVDRDQAKIESSAWATNTNAGNLDFYTQTTTGNNLSLRMRIDGTGNVGIGTTDPTEKLHIQGRAYISGTGNRPVTVDGNVNIKLEAGGWATQYGFIGSSGTDRGGFGGYGNGDVLGYYWIGSSYSSPSLVVNSNGNVGIGVASPSYPLDLQKSISDTYSASTAVNSELLLFNTNSSANTYSAITLSTYGAGVGSTVGSVSLIALGASDSYSADFVVQQRSISAVYKENFRITHQGAVGIGTDDPISELHVRHNDNNTAEITIEGGGTGNAGLRFIPGNQTNPYYAYVDTNRNFRIQDLATERFRISSTGNVGIGTDNPGAKLDVYHGEVQIRSSAAYNTHLNYQDAGSHYLTVANDGATIFRGSSNGITAAIIYGGGTAQFNGNVGIGTGNLTFGQSTPISTYDPKLGIQGSILIGNLSTTASDRYELQFYRRNGAAGQPIDTHDMGRIAWYGSNNDTDNASLTWSIGVNPDGGGWTAGANRKGYMTFNNHNGELIRITSSGVIRHGTNLYSGSYTGEKIVIAAEPTAGDTSTVVIGEEYAGSANPSISLFRRDGSTLYSGYGYRISNFVGKLNFSYASTALPGNHSFNPKVTFDQSGNVGIGTTNPNRKLHVNGPTKIFENNQYPPIVYENRYYHVMKGKVINTYNNSGTNYNLVRCIKSTNIQYFVEVTARSVNAVSSGASISVGYAMVRWQGGTFITSTIHQNLTPTYDAGGGARFTIGWVADGNNYILRATSTGTGYYSTLFDIKVHNRDAGYVDFFDAPVFDG